MQPENQRKQNWCDVKMISRWGHLPRAIIRVFNSLCAISRERKKDVEIMVFIIIN